jgi:hypothetical protein
MLASWEMCFCDACSYLSLPCVLAQTLACLGNSLLCLLLLSLPVLCRRPLRLMLGSWGCGWHCQWGSCQKSTTRCADAVQLLSAVLQG